jgi:integrase
MGAMTQNHRTKALTTKAIENLKPRDERYEVPDGGCRGLRCLVHPSGAKSWAIRFRWHRKPCKHTLGSFPGMSLAEARQAAAAAMAQVARGIDPRNEKREAKAAAAERSRNTVDLLTAQFREWQGKRLRPASLRQLEHIFTNIVVPAWQGRDVHSIARRDAIELTEAVAETKPIMANRVHSHLYRFFGWLCERDVIVASPMVGVPRPAAESARERTLSEREIVQLWHACEAVEEPARSWIRMLILLGQRRSETVSMRRSEIDGDLWRLPAEKMKGKVAHTLPLPAQALAMVEALPPIGDGDLVFTTNGTSPLSHFDRIKRTIDAEMKPASPWTWHDIRRSSASALAGLGVPVPTIEKILAHRSGTFRGIVSTYQRHSFIPEMRTALERWSEHLDRLVRGAPATKVVPIGRR